MKKLQYILILSLLLVPFGFAQAANDVSITADTNITLTSPSMTLVLANGSTYKTMTVTASTVAFTLSASGTITLTSNDKYVLNNDKAEYVTNTCGSSSSSIVYGLSAGAADSTITFTPGTATCDGGSSSSSGSSGGGSGSATSSAKPATGTQAIAKTVGGSTGGSVATTDNKAGMQVPDGIAGGNVSMNITPKASSSYAKPTGTYKALASQVYDFSLSSGGSAITSFSNSVTLTFKYTNSDVSGLNEDSLTVYYWDTTSSKWIAVSTTVDKEAKTVTANTTHFTVFGVFGEQAPITVQGIMAGDLIKTSDRSAVYYLGTDNKRYIFTTESTYKSWYADFSAVKTIAQADMDKLDEFGGNVTFRPGTWLIKFPTVPNVYAVEQGGVLRHIASEAIAKSLYGAEWWKWVKEVAEENYMSYTVGNDITEAKYPAGSLIKYASSPDIYYISGDGTRKLFSSMNAFNVNRMQDQFVVETDIVYSDGAQITGEESDLSTTAGQ